MAILNHSVEAVVPIEKVCVVCGEYDFEPPNPDYICEGCRDLEERY